MQSRKDKSRSLAFEETFFHTFERWFRMTPLLSRTRPPQPTAVNPPHTAHEPPCSTEAPQWTVHGKTQDVFVYVCRRRRGTLPDVLGWTPGTDEEVMAGPRVRRSAREDDALEAEERAARRADAGEEHGWGWAEAQLGAIEWE